jgi:hypothetical protein
MILLDTDHLTLLKNTDNPQCATLVTRLELVIVGKFRPKDRESVSRVRRVFKDYAVKLFKTSELPQLVDEFRRTGKESEDGSKDAR